MQKLTVQKDRANANDDLEGIRRLQEETEYLISDFSYENECLRGVIKKLHKDELVDAYARFEKNFDDLANRHKNTCEEISVLEGCLEEGKTSWDEDVSIIRKLRKNPRSSEHNLRVPARWRCQQG